MHTVKFLFPIVFGLILTLGWVGGLALASGNVAALKAPADTILYVDAEAIGAATGLSWSDAYTSLQDALMIAISGTEIWVAEGVYYPDEGVGQTDDAVTSTFGLTDGVAMFGGFAATETLRTQRDWDTHVTVLSGDVDHETSPDITDQYGLVTNTANIAGANAYHVVSSSGVSATAVVDGFSITAGSATGDYELSGQWSGGGIYNVWSDPTLLNMTFSGNRAEHDGGGMYNAASNPALINVVFSGNSAEYYGGGLYNQDNSDPLLTNVTFSANISEFGDGGGIYNDTSSPILINVFFSGNKAFYGGGMYNHASSPTLLNVFFSSNLAVYYGGAMCNRDNSDSTLTNVTFSGNLAQYDGGGLHNWGSSPVLINVTFSGNSTRYGGGMYNVYESHPTLTNVTFSGNSVDNFGGAIYNDESSPSLGNSILWGNTAIVSGTQIYNVNNSTPVISYSDIQDSGGSGAGWNPNLGVDGGGNIDTDPLFWRNPDPGNNDFGDLHLQPGSPAIDTGTNDGCPATDLDGNPRPINGVCDMGAYETNYMLFLSKNVDDLNPEPGQTITFTIVATPSGLDVTGGLISDSLPAGLNFLGPITLDPTDAGLIGTIPPILASSLVISSGERITVTFPVTVSYGLPAGTQLVNTALFSSTEVTIKGRSSVTLTVQNTAPIANPDGDTGYRTDEDTIFTTANVLANDTDLNGDALSVQSFNTTGTLGSVTSNGDGTFDYDPNGQFEVLGQGEWAHDTFTYTVSDGHGGTDTAPVTITITGIQNEVYIYLPLLMR